ncbi:MAG: hypothetical protein VX464_21270 [Pseudomonadota bacterium]|nr:hypothetical protein [Pseudomonadota bacterium]
MLGQMVGAVSVLVGGLSLIFGSPVVFGTILIVLGIVAMSLPFLNRSDLWRTFLTFLPFGPPIVWSFCGFLGGSRYGKEEIYISVFQISGKVSNISGTFINNAKIVSDISKKEIPVSIKTEDGYVDSSDLSYLQPGTIIYAHALFYDPAEKKDTETREGMPESSFLESWGAFRLVIRYGRNEYVRRFTEEDVLAQVRRLYPARSTISPRPTRKSSSHRI